MTNSILLGAIDNLSLDQIKPFCLSAREKLDSNVIIYLVAYRINDDIRKFCESLDINLYEVELDNYGNKIDYNQPIHCLRFWHWHELLTRLTKENELYDYVLSCDTRDIIFQDNIFNKIKTIFNSNNNNIYSDITDYKLIVSSEGIIFDNEPWNKSNMISGFGNLYYELNDVRNWVAYNVGIIASSCQVFIKDFYKILFSMTEKRYFPSDQSAYNILLHTFYTDTIRTGHGDNFGFCCQGGVMLEESKNNLKVCGLRPIIDNGIVKNEHGIIFSSVHQWERSNQLRPIIEKKYL